MVAKQRTLAEMLAGMGCEPRVVASFAVDANTVLPTGLRVEHGTERGGDVLRLPAGIIVWSMRRGHQVEMHAFAHRGEWVVLWRIVECHPLEVMVVDDPLEAFRTFAATYPDTRDRRGGGWGAKRGPSWVDDSTPGARRGWGPQR